MFHVEHEGITIRALKKGDLYRGFVIYGHANSAPYGQDIVCAAVSALSQTVLRAVEKYSPCTSSLKPGLTFLNIHDEGISEENHHAVQVLLDTLVHGMHMIDTGYPGYITFEEDDVSSNPTENT